MSKMVELSRAIKGQRATPGETKVLELVGRGLSTKIIAHKLGVTESTIKARIQVLCIKYGAENRVQLALAVHGLPYGEE